MPEPAPVIPLTPRTGDRATAKDSSSRLPDPVGELRFTVKVGDTVIAGFTECTGLSAEYDIFEYQEGGEDRFVRKFRGRLKWPNLVLKRGVTHQKKFLEWFYDRQERDSRPTVTISLLGDDGNEVCSWSLAGAFPVKWQGPSLNATSTSVATETLEIAHEGLLANA